MKLAELEWRDGPYNTAWEVATVGRGCVARSRFHLNYHVYEDWDGNERQEFISPARWKNVDKLTVQALIYHLLNPER